MMKKQTMKANAAVIVAALLVASFCLDVSLANSVRSSRRGAVAVGEEGKGAAVGRRGAVVKGEEGYAAVGRGGAVVSGEEGYAAVNRRGGAVVAGEEGYAAVGPPWRRGGGQSLRGLRGLEGCCRSGCCYCHRHHAGKTPIRSGYDDGGWQLVLVR